MLKNKTLRVLVIAIALCVIYTSWLSGLEPVRLANLKIIDTFFSLSSRFSSLPASAQNVALVTVDDESLRNAGIPWPWPRSVMADIIKKISAGKPELLCVDFVFAGQSPDPQEDSGLADALKEAGNVYAAAYFGSDGKYVVPEEQIALSLKDFGFVNKPRDIDNTIRRMRPYFLSTEGDIIDYSLSLKLVGHVSNTLPAKIALSVPVSRDGIAYIKFFGNLDRFDSIPAWKILKNIADISMLKKRIVFFGVTSESFHDTYHTPLGIMPGVVIDLNEFLTYANKSFFRYANHEMNAMILFIFVLIAVYGSLRLPVLSGAALSACEIALCLSLGMFLFIRHVIIDAFGPAIVVLASSMFLQSTRYVILAVENMLLRKEATTDGLTHLYVYRYFELQLGRELKKALAYGKNLSLVIYDIDHFKKINDAYGHEFGNSILKAIGKALLDHSRKNNIIARYGGEEFCIIVPGMKRQDAVKYAERLRNLISHLEFKTDKEETIKITMSAGIVNLEGAKNLTRPTDVIKAADAALYKSKNTGRDRITVFE